MAVPSRPPAPTKGHLRVVDTPTFSALPHEVMDDKRLSRDARFLYAVMQRYWWKSGECWASNATLKDDMSCSDSQLRRYLGELKEAGWIVARRWGKGQAKAYAPVQPYHQPFTDERFNRSEESGYEADQEPNRSLVTTEPVTDERFNRSPVTVPIKKTSKKKTIEEDVTPNGVVEAAADAALSKPENPAVQELFDYYRSKIQSGAKIRPDAKIKTRLKRFTLEELKQGIDRFAADAWWMEHNSKRGAAWFFESDARSEQFLNLATGSPDRRSARNGSTRHDQQPQVRAAAQTITFGPGKKFTAKEG